MTNKAQNNRSRWKKIVANAILFKAYAEKAMAIQFLTMNEAKSVGLSWNKRHFILPNGITPPKAIKQSFSPDGINATFIGRLDIFQKGIDILIQACAESSNDLRAANFNLHIYGPHNKDYELIQTMIRANKLVDIVFLEDETSGKDKEKVILGTDLFVLTSRFEGHPMGLIEALAYGVPAIVTPGTNMADEIAKSDAGWVCNEASADAIKTQLQNVLKERFILANKGANAAKLAKKYDWDVLAENFHKEVKQILATL